jgi:nucleoside-diphosphate-sugar epimerase
VNIGSGQPVALRDIILTIANYAGNGANLEIGAVRSPETEPPLLVADVRRLEREVQWRPEYSLQTGIEQAVNWWRTELSTTGEQQGATELKEQAWQGTRASS